MHTETFETKEPSETIEPNEISKPNETSENSEVNKPSENWTLKTSAPSEQSERKNRSCKTTDKSV